VRARPGRICTFCRSRAGHAPACSVNSNPIGPDATRCLATRYRARASPPTDELAARTVERLSPLAEARLTFPKAAARPGADYTPRTPVTVIAPPRTRETVSPRRFVAIRHRSSARKPSSKPARRALAIRAAGTGGHHQYSLAASRQVVSSGSRCWAGSEIVGGRRSRCLTLGPPRHRSLVRGWRTPGKTELRHIAVGDCGDGISRLIDRSQSIKGRVEGNRWGVLDTERIGLWPPFRCRYVSDPVLLGTGSPTRCPVRVSASSLAPGRVMIAAGLRAPVVAGPSMLPRVPVSAGEGSAASGFAPLLRAEPRRTCLWRQRVALICALDRAGR
jgi:hypothetical protein